MGVVWDECVVVKVFRGSWDWISYMEFFIFIIWVGFNSYEFGIRIIILCFCFFIMG